MFGARLEQTGINAADYSTFWKHTALIDILHAQQDVYTVPTPQGVNSQLTQEAQVFMTNHKRIHRWINSSQGKCTVKFYQLTPRMDLMQIQNQTGGAAQAGARIAPQFTDDYAAGACQEDPELITRGWSNFAPTTVPGSAQIQPSDPSLNLRSNPALRRLFKIKALKVSTPQGRKSSCRLNPGEECTYVGKYRMRSLNLLNYYLMSHGQTIDSSVSTWHCLRSTPLILIRMIGQVAHSTADKTKVVLAPCYVDYVNTCSYDVWTLDPARQATIVTHTTNTPAVADPAQADVQIEEEPQGQ